METIENDDGTVTTIFGYTDRGDVYLKGHPTDADHWILQFSDDGDPVVLQWVPRWQLKRLQKLIAKALR